VVTIEALDRSIAVQVDRDMISPEKPSVIPHGRHQA
jgi:hypothetical protein